MNILDICLLVAIVENGSAEKIVDAAKSHGATGATIVMGRGSGRAGNQKILGFEIEAEQEIVFIVISRDIADSIINEIYETMGFGEKGSGLAFVVPIEHVIGLDLNTKIDVSNESSDSVANEPNEIEEKSTDNENSEDITEYNKDDIPNIWPDDELIPENMRNRVGDF